MLYCLKEYESYYIAYRNGESFNLPIGMVSHAMFPVGMVIHVRLPIGMVSYAIWPIQMVSPFMLPKEW